MNPDDMICHCYHVSMRKLVNYARRENPSRPSQMTKCLNAGTGCGWCIPFLIRIAEDAERFALEDLDAEEYAAQRKSYLSDKDSKNSFEPQD